MSNDIHCPNSEFLKKKTTKKKTKRFNGRTKIIVYQNTKIKQTKKMMIINTRHKKAKIKIKIM